MARNSVIPPESFEEILGWLNPDRELAARVQDEMRERGVLVGTTGRHGNILKIRPPLAITADEAGVIPTRLGQVLTDLER